MISIRTCRNTVVRRFPLTTFGLLVAVLVQGLLLLALAVLVIGGCALAPVERGRLTVATAERAATASLSFVAEVDRVRLAEITREVAVACRGVADFNDCKQR